MSRASTIPLKDALKVFEAKEYERRIDEKKKKGEDAGDVPPVKAAEEKHVKLWPALPKLQGNQYPFDTMRFIERMDMSLSGIPQVERLSLSSNIIEKIQNLNNLRNMIKSLAGIEAVADTLEQLFISNNYIDKLRNLTQCKKLQVLYINWNYVRDINEVQKLEECTSLVELGMIGNPIEVKHSEDGSWRDLIGKTLTKLKRLDNKTLLHEE